MHEFSELISDDNPIDNVEEVLSNNNWTYIRTSQEEVLLKVSGKNSKYHICFLWNEKMNALQFACRHNIEFNEANIVKAQRAVMTINEGLWMGHYDIPADTMTPTFRYTCLLRGSEKASLTETIEDIVDIALIQCERHYPSLELISTVDSTVMNDNNFSLALMETVGES